MNIYQNTQVSGLIHKLSKYQTLLARAPSHKANVYESKVNSYKNQLSQIGYGMNQEGGVYEFKDGVIKDSVTQAPIAPADLVSQIQASNTAYSEQSKNLGIRYNAIIVKLQDVFSKYVELANKLKLAEDNLDKEKAAHTLTQTQVSDLEAQKLLLENKIADLSQEKARLEAEIARLQQALLLTGAEITQLQDKLVVAQRQLDDVNRQLETATQQLVKVNQQLQEANNTILLQAVEIQKCNEQLATLTAENTSLKGQIGTATMAINQLANVTFTPPSKVNLQPINIVAPANMSPDVQALFDQLMNDPDLKAKLI